MDVDHVISQKRPKAGPTSRYSTSTIIGALQAVHLEISTRAYTKILTFLNDENMVPKNSLEIPHYTTLNNYSLLYAPLAEAQIVEFLEKSTKLCLYMGKVSFLDLRIL